MKLEICVTCTDRAVTLYLRLRVVPHFSSGIVERAKREGACFARSTVPEKTWGTQGGLLVVYFILPQGEEHKAIGLK